MKKDNEIELDVEYDLVFIIDCLPEGEYNDLRISQDLMQYLADNGIQQTTSICRNEKLLIATLQYLVRLAASGIKFCLHIISHGDTNGLYIKSTEQEIPWIKFRNFLKNINNAMGKTLMLNMTSCLGLHGIKIVDKNSIIHPFFGLIGYSDDLEVNRAKEINKLFYQKMVDNKPVNIAVQEIKKELTDDKLYCISAIGYKAIKNTLNKQ